MFVTEIYLSIFRPQQNGCNLAFMSASDHEQFASAVEAYGAEVSSDFFILGLYLSLFHHFRRTDEIIIIENMNVFDTVLVIYSSGQYFTRNQAHTLPSAMHAFVSFETCCKTLFYFMFLRQRIRK